jgi:hypothetical protein
LVCDDWIVPIANLVEQGKRTLNVKLGGGAKEVKDGVQPT